MTINMDIQRISEDDSIPSDEQLKTWAESAISPEHHAWEVTLRLIDKDEMQTLNQEWRGKDKPTNVLSIPFTQPATNAKIEVLGDLAICAPLVAEEAQEQDISTEAHWAHLMIHGILHLQGYDHAEEVEAQIMEAKEIEILDRLGFENPYE